MKLMYHRSNLEMFSIEVVTLNKGYKMFKGLINSENLQMKFRTKKARIIQIFLSLKQKIHYKS
jgi:hypothetical protein